MHLRFGEALATLPIEFTGPDSKFMRDFEGVKKDFGRRSATSLPIGLFMSDVVHSSQYAGGEVILFKFVIVNSSSDLVLCNDIQIAMISGRL